MKLILIACIGFLLGSSSCNTAKRDNAKVTKDELLIRHEIDSSAVKFLDSVPSQTTAAIEKQVNKIAFAKVVPDKVKISNCIKSLIKRFKKEEKQNPPRNIYSYKYKDQTVYYVSAVCCDKYSDLYDNNCKLIGHPDGGLTGRGDAMLTDFIKLKKDEKLLWQDERN